MTSGYALPGSTAYGSHHHHGHGHAHSHSHTGTTYLTPNIVANGHFQPSNGNIKKAASHGNLYTHSEASRETTPLASPTFEQHQFAPQQLPVSHSPQSQSSLTSIGIHRNLNHSRPHSHTSSPMRGRARGESDLGKPSVSHGPGHKVGHNNIASRPQSGFNLTEAITGLLLPLPYLLASAAYSYTALPSEDDGLPPLSAYKELENSVLSDSWNTHTPIRHHGSGFVEACTLTAGTLIAVGLCRRIVGSNAKESTGKATAPSPRTIARRVLSVGLPYFAAMKVGGMRTGLVLTCAAAAGLSSTNSVSRPALHEWKHLLSQRIATLSVIILCFLADLSGLTITAPSADLVLGYLALAAVVAFVPWPLSPGQSSGDDNANLAAGTLVGVVAAIFTFVTSAHFPFTGSVMTFGALSILATTTSLIIGQPPSLYSEHKAGLGIGCLLTASCAFLFSPSLWPGTICNGGLSALAFTGILFDTTSSIDKHRSHDHHHDHTHTNHSHAHHHHDHKHFDRQQSGLTKALLARVPPGSLVHSILSEKDSRRIAYFTTLNFGFMFVQGVYGYLSGSLGLLSDTVHMFFDCLALVVGLGAAVASKWPTSPEKPYGWVKLNTLAGFGNGIFLMLVSVEFVWEAVEGILEGKELRHVKELLVVSTLGLIVNMIGLFAFGHAHAGHDHGHSHGHDHHNENMHGIFLHVAADAGGSLAVIISTSLTLWKPSYLWDPLAAIIIAILIFAAAVPLVTSSGQKLLLVIPDDLEYNIKNALQELSEIRGVIGYAAPRFWVDDKEEATATHDHHDHHHHHPHHDHHEHHEPHHDHRHEHNHTDHDRHDHSHGNTCSQKLRGVIHVIAANNADLDDIRERVEGFVKERNMDLVIHVEREGDPQCWCGGVQK